MDTRHRTDFDCKSYSRGNNARYVRVGHLELWFSYRTVIAFQLTRGDGGRTACVCENVWGATTGRHIKEAAEELEIVARAPANVFAENLSTLLRGMFCECDMDPTEACHDPGRQEGEAPVVIPEGDSVPL